MNKARWLTLALLLSLAVNLLVAGVFVGRAMSGRSAFEHIPPNLGWMIRHLDNSTRQELHADLEEHVRRVRPLRREMRDAQRSFNRQLIAHELDQDAITDSLKRLRTASDKYQTEMHGMMLRIIPELDERQRRKISSSLRRKPGRDQPPRRREHREKP